MTRWNVSTLICRTRSLSKRCGFLRLLDRLEQDDVLIVTKMDRLGRDAIDVGSTVGRLADLGVRVRTAWRLSGSI